MGTAPAMDPAFRQGTVTIPYSFVTVPVFNFRSAITVPRYHGDLTFGCCVHVSIGMYDARTVLRGNGVTALSVVL